MGEDILGGDEPTRADIEKENRELKEEIQECHEILDRVGSDARDSLAGASAESLRLPARIVRFCLEVLGRLLGGNNG